MSVRMNPYIVCDGNAMEAIAFYEKALDAKNGGIMKFGDMPFAGMPEEAKDRVMHAELIIGENYPLMFSDTFPGQPHSSGNQVYITLVTTTVAEAEKYFEALSAGAQIEMPLQKTDWSAAYGSLKDRFGVHWQVNADIRE
jgi:PhnB protein